MNKKKSAVSTPYKAAVVRVDGDDDIHVFVQLRDGQLLGRSIGMSDHEGHYAEFDKFDIGLAWLHVEDGTEPVELENILESNPEFEDIFFKLSDVKRVCLYDKKESKVPVKTIIKNNELETTLLEIFENELDLLDPVKHN